MSINSPYQIDLKAAKALQKKLTLIISSLSVDFIINNYCPLDELKARLEREFSEEKK